MFTVQRPVECSSGPLVGFCSKCGVLGCEFGIDYNEGRGAEAKVSFPPLSQGNLPFRPLRSTTHTH